MFSTSNLTFQGAATLLIEALKAVMEDNGFNIPSENALMAKNAAVKLSMWALKEENIPVLQSFAVELTTHLSKAFNMSIRQVKHQRELMWARYHNIRTSSEFVSQWSSFTSCSIDEPATPILTQHLTDLVFRHMIRQQWPLEKSTNGTEGDLPALSFEEKSALRYAGGCVSKSQKEARAIFSSAKGRACFGHYGTIGR